MLNKLDLKNYDKVVGNFDFKDLTMKEKADELAHAIYNKVRYQKTFLFYVQNVG